MTLWKELETLDPKEKEHIEDLKQMFSFGVIAGLFLGGFVGGIAGWILGQFLLK